MATQKLSSPVLAAAATAAEPRRPSFATAAEKAIREAMGAHTEPKIIAKFIKNQMEVQFEGPWQVIVGTGFGR